MTRRLDLKSFLDELFLFRDKLIRIWAKFNKLMTQQKHTFKIVMRSLSTQIKHCLNYEESSVKSHAWYKGAMFPMYLWQAEQNASASILYLQLCHQCVIAYWDRVQSLWRIYICRVWSHVAIKRKNLHMQSVMEAITPGPLPWSLTSVRGPGHPPAKSCLVPAG